MSTKGFERGFILGAVIGDGNISIRDSVSSFQVEIEQKNKNWLEILNQCFVHVFNKKGKITERKQKNTFRLRICSKEIAKELMRLKLNIKFILHPSSKEFKIGFLRGFFDAEGSVHRTKNRITVSSKNREILETVRGLLLELGINAGKSWKNRNGIEVLAINGQKTLRPLKK